jgi:predicted nucleotidyltransferase
LTGGGNKGGKRATTKPSSFFGALAIFRADFHTSICDQLVGQAFAVAGGDYDSYMSSTADEALIEEAGRRLAEAAPGARVILFGSRARGEARPDSDLDLLVIEPGEVTKRRAETARLKRELRGLEVALDVIVVSAKHVEEWGHFDGTVLNEALSEGRILVQA